MSTSYTGSWQEDGLCRQVSPALMFPEPGESADPGKQVCAGCPVLVKCRDHALRHNERFGVWGGLSENDRKRLRRQARTASVVPLAAPAAPESPRRAA